MAKKTFSVRLDSAKSLAVEELAEERDISESDALRILIHNGIEYRRTTRHIDKELTEINKKVDRVEKRTEPVTKRCVRFVGSLSDRFHRLRR